MEVSSSGEGPVQWGSSGSISSGEGSLEDRLVGEESDSKTADKTNEVFTYNSDVPKATLMGKERLTQNIITGGGKIAQFTPGLRSIAKKVSSYIRESAFGTQVERKGGDNPQIYKFLRERNINIEKFENMKESLENELKELEKGRDVDGLYKKKDRTEEENKFLEERKSLVDLINDFDTRILEEQGMKSKNIVFPTPLSVLESQDTEKNLDRLVKKLGGEKASFKITNKKSEDVDIQGMLFGTQDQKFDPDKKTVLLFTGSHNRAENYAFPMVEKLQSLGAQVMIVNPPGFGDSGGEATGKNFLLAAEGSMAFLENLGVEKQNVAAMGYSLGGPLAAHVAAKNPGMRFIGDRTYTSIADVAAQETAAMVGGTAGKAAGKLMKPLLKNIIGDLNTDKNMKRISGKKFVASGTGEKGKFELAKQKDLDSNTEVVEFEGEHHHDDKVWFAQETEQAKEFEDFINDFLNEGEETSEGKGKEIVG